MGGKTHQFVALTLMLAMVVLNPKLGQFGGVLYYPILALLFAPLGSIVADIDMQRSSMGLKHKWLAKIFTHRGITHTFIVTYGLYMLTYFMDKSANGNGFTMILVRCILSMIIGFTIAYLSHIFSDSLNGKGVPLLWPLTNRRIHLARITTGTVEESIFVVVWFILVVVHIVSIIGGWIL